MCGFQPSSDFQWSKFLLNLNTCIIETRQRVLPEVVTCSCHLGTSTLLPLCLGPAYFPALTLCPRQRCKHPEHWIPFVLLQAPKWFCLFSNFHPLFFLSFYYFFILSLVHDNRSKRKQCGNKLKFWKKNHQNLNLVAWQSWKKADYPVSCSTS